MYNKLTRRSNRGEDVVVILLRNEESIAVRSTDIRKGISLFIIDISATGDNSTFGRAVSVNQANIFPELGIILYYRFAYQR